MMPGLNKIQLHHTTMEQKMERGEGPLAIDGGDQLIARFC